MANIELGAYFYPLTTRCPEKQRRAKLNGELMGIHGGLEVVDETVLASNATPLFEGHQQPNAYTLDGTNSQWDDADPQSIDTQIGLAHDAGLRFFVFDSYEGSRNGELITESATPVENFRKLSRIGGLKYAKMETFASPRVVIPVSKDPKFYEAERLYDLDTSTLRYIVDSCATNDWNNPNYLFVNGKPYLSLFIPDLTPGWKAGSERLRHIIEEMREYSNKKYKIDPYLVGSIRTVAQAEELTAAGVDGLTGYAFLPIFGDNVAPIQEYSSLVEQRQAEWPQIGKINSFVPPAVVGWDASPRGKSAQQLGTTIGHGYAPIVVGSTPDSFEKMLRESLNYTRENVPLSEQYGIICAWNEITEGAALLPKILSNGSIDDSYLRAVKSVINDENRNGN